MSSVHDDVPGDELPGVVAAQAADDAEETISFASDVGSPFVLS